MSHNDGTVLVVRGSVTVIVVVHVEEAEVVVTVSVASEARKVMLEGMRSSQ